MRVRTVVALAGLVAAPLGAQQQVPGVDVWTTTAPTALAHGAQVSARAMADGQAYLVVFRVTPDRRIVVLVPNSPNASYRVPKGGLRGTGVDVSFLADSVNGVGHVYAVSSYTPFDFETVRSGDAWDLSQFTTLPTNSSIALADAFVRQIVPSRSTAYGMNDIDYYVGVTPPADAGITSHTETVVTYVPSSSGHVVSDDAFDDYSSMYYWGYSSGWRGGNVWYPGDYWYNDNYWNSPYLYGYSYGYLPYGAYGYATPYYKQCSNGTIVSIYSACSVSTPTRTKPSPRRPLPVASGPVAPITRGVPGTAGLAPSRPVPGMPGLAPAPRLAPSPRLAPAPRLAPPPQLSSPATELPPIIGHRRPHGGHHASQPSQSSRPPAIGVPATSVPPVTPPRAVARPARPDAPIRSVPVTPARANPAPVRPAAVAAPPRPAPPPPPPPRQASPPPPPPRHENPPPREMRPVRESPQASNHMR